MSGQPISGAHVIIEGDVCEVLRDFDANTFDACFCDPPYLLEFMGKAFDKQHKAMKGANDGQKMQAWHEAWCREVYRVLKPGGFVLAFGGTRTVHRLASAMEDVGLEIRDTLCWLYGCLSEDTEILVDGLWEPYHKNLTGRLALCYDSTHDEYSWQPIEDHFIYPYCDTAYRLHSDRTDQLVTRNHRCLVERSGRYVFEAAESLACEQEASIPILESVSQLLDDLPMSYQGASSQKQTLFNELRWLQTEKEKAVRGERRSHQSLLCRLWCRYLEIPFSLSIGRESDVFEEVQRRAKRQGMGETRMQGEIRLDRGVNQESPIQDDWREKSCLERWCDVLQETRELLWSALCQMSRGVYGNGAEGRLCYGASVDCRSNIGPMSTSLRSCASRGQRSDKQREDKPESVCEQSRPQTVRASRYTTSDLARIEPVKYDGIVWCVKVPTGAFVARRNDKIFVTGNSGFPKSLDLSKAMDGVLGKQSRATNTAGRGERSDIQAKKQLNDKSLRSSYGYKYSPKSDNAVMWSGYGTALKPSHEPLVLAMKPTQGTFAQNALTWGVAGLNIDQCRIGIAHDDAIFKTNPHTQGGFGHADAQVYGESQGAPTYVIPSGRWPANLLLAHHASCREVGTRRVRTGVAVRHRSGGKNIHTDIDKPAMADMTYADADGMEEVAAWECHPECPVRMLDEQAGDRGGGLATRGASTRIYGGGKGFTANTGEEIGYGDNGGPSRFFYTAKVSTRERNMGSVDCRHATLKPMSLTEYLSRLLLPPARADNSLRQLLIPFSGAGSEVAGALRAGWDLVIGIENDAESVQWAEARVAAAVRETETGIREPSKGRRKAAAGEQAAVVEPSAEAEGIAE